MAEIENQGLIQQMYDLSDEEKYFLLCSLLGQMEGALKANADYEPENFFTTVKAVLAGHLKKEGK